MDNEQEKNPRGENPEKQGEQHLAPVVTGKAAVKKKSEWRKFFGNFFHGDINKISISVWDDVLDPMIRDMLWGALERAAKGFIYGESGGGRSSADRNSIPARQVDFTSFSKSRRERRDDFRSREREDIYDYGEIFVENRQDAEAVASRMDELLDRYKWASVAQLYELAGLRSKYTDRSYGWRVEDRGSITISRIRDGYLIKMPRPKPLD